MRSTAHPTVSVIVPCYNSEATVGATLDCLLPQTFRDWEAIVVNDGSTDGSVDVVRRYEERDARIRRVDRENGGLSAARNTGLEVAQGTFVNFLDADDLLLPNALERMVNALRKNAIWGAVHCGFILSDPTARERSWVSTPPQEGQVFAKLAHGNPFPCHSILLHRAILDEVGLFDCALKCCGDWDLWQRVARAGTHFGCLREPLVVYRMMPVSLSRNPLMLFEEQKNILHRGHTPDPRVLHPAPEFAQGCACSMKEALLGRLLESVGMTIAQGNAARAAELFETACAEEGLQATPKQMKWMMHTLWFGTAIPRGNWDALWEKVSRPLLQFLVRQEERLNQPGYAMECVLEMVEWHALRRKSSPDALGTRQLIGALRKKVARRLPHFGGSSRTDPVL